MANEKDYLYKVILEDGYYVDYKYERAKKLFDREGIRMYAYTKNLFPTTILMYWKRPMVSSFFCIAYGQMFAYNEDT